jgi:putative ABC transport system permease protein
MMLAPRFAGRELRSGIRGFRVFLACLALGVAALAAAGSTAEAFRQGLATQSRAILGGDVSAAVQDRRFAPGEVAALNRLGRISEVLHVRAMAEGPTGERRLSEVRGVDGAYPLAGHVLLRGAPSLAQALQVRGGLPGAAVDIELMRRLGLTEGQAFQVGEARFRVGARLVSEPDGLGRGFALGPSILVGRDALQRSGLAAGDALYGDTVRVALRPGLPLPLALRDARAAAGDGAEVRGRNQAVAGLGELIDQLQFFLGFIGLVSLLAGGLGVSTAVSAYLDTRRGSIATLKALGASGALVRNVYLLQVSALAAVGIVLGLLVGAATPFALGAVVGDRLPIPVLFALYPAPLFEAAGFGALTAAAFSLGALARARAASPAALFRRDPGGRAGWGLDRAAQALASVGLLALGVTTAPTPAVAAGMITAVLLAFGLLLLLGWGCARLAAAGRKAVHGPARLALSNLGGGGSAARTATPAIGLGVALLATILLIQSSLLSEVRDAAPRAAPSLILTEIPPERAAEFERVMAAAMGPLTPERYRRTAFATGRITQVKGRSVDAAAIAPGVRWAFDHDIGLTTLAGPPPDADVVAGRWWPANYAGPPQVMLSRDVAEGAGLKVGDTITVSLLGRDLPARIAGLRAVEPGRFGASFTLVLDPAALAGANLRQIAIARTTPAQDARISSALGGDFPAVNVISVREGLAEVTKVFGQLAWAVRGAAAVAGLAGLLVLAGAISATSEARAREAAILKVLGGDSGQILFAYGLEYGLVGLIAGTLGVLVGVVCAWPVVTLVFHIAFSPAPLALAALLALATGVCASAGLGAAAKALLSRPAPILREA